MSEPNIDILSERLKQAATLEEYRRIQCVYLKAKHGYPSKQIAEITTYHGRQRAKNSKSMIVKRAIECLSPKPRGGLKPGPPLRCLMSKPSLTLFAPRQIAGQIIEISCKFRVPMKPKWAGVLVNQRFTRFSNGISGVK